MKWLCRVPPLVFSLWHAAAECSPLPCRENTGFPGNDLVPLPGIPNPYPSAGYEGCAIACRADALCRVFTVVETGLGSCNATGGCCLLKSAGAGANASTVEGHCSAIIRPDPSSFPPLPSPMPAPKGAKNIIHIISDDLRPDLSAYGQAFMSTPNLQVSRFFSVSGLARGRAINGTLPHVSL
jgi:hypothetical protein